jgi:hypothetical protein
MKKRSIKKVRGGRTKRNQRDSKFYIICEKKFEGNKRHPEQSSLAAFAIRCQFCIDNMQRFMHLGGVCLIPMLCMEFNIKLASSKMVL